MLAEARIRNRTIDRSGAAACRHFYGHLVHYLAGHPGLTKLRKEITQTTSIDKLLAKTRPLLLNNGY